MITRLLIAVTAAAAVYGLVALLGGDGLTAAMIGLLALVGGVLAPTPASLREPAPDTAGRRSTSVLIAATVVATLAVAIGWSALWWASGLCSEVTAGSSADRYCGFIDEHKTGLFIAAATAPLITLLGGIIAIRRHRPAALVISAAIGAGIIILGALPFRLA